MRNFFSALGDNLAWTISVSLALIVAGLVLGGGFSYTNRVTVDETTARVVSVGPGHDETYQCGSNKVGDVSVPVYCTRTEYPVTFAVAKTDETFAQDVTSAPAVGADYTAYKITDGDHYSYGLDNPKSAGFAILIWVFAILGAAVIGLLAFVITDAIVG